MNKVRVAAVTKAGNPLPRRGSCTLWVCDKSDVELTLRAMPPATDASVNGMTVGFEEVAR